MDAGYEAEEQVSYVDCICPTVVNIPPTKLKTPMIIYKSHVYTCMYILDMHKRTTLIMDGTSFLVHVVSCQHTIGLG